MASSVPMALVEVMNAAEAAVAAGDGARAVSLYREWLGQPGIQNAYAAFFNLGVLLADAGSRLEAESCFRQCLHDKPDFFPAYLNLGIQLENLGRPAEAVALWETALQRPELAAGENKSYRVQLANSLGRLLENLREYERAEAALLSSLEVEPGQQPVLQHWAHLRQRQCKWPVAYGVALAEERVMESVSPLALLGLTDDPALQLASARRHAEARIVKAERLVAAGHRYGHRRLRIGYLSSDFCMHAVSLLLAELLESHDRGRVEVHGFCWSREDGTPMRRRVLAAFDHYHPIGRLSDAAAAELIRSREIDVLVDLQGLTSGARPDIPALGPAPIQIAYLGFPGTSAIPHVDYVVADRFVFPPELARHFSERPLYLPTVFQVADGKREIGETSRQEQGLPENALVFCAFNNNHKILPEMFEAWMRILRRVPHALLWLLADNPWAERNLRAAAMAHGVSPARLCFAGRVAPADYLARFRLADLFLDTSPFNAGTTANDALWAGLPILTLSGKSYASRMAGSLLKSAGLDDFITWTLAGYEERAVFLAHDRARLAQARLSLERQKSEGSLFSTRRFAKEWEDALWALAGGGSDSPARFPAPQRSAFEAGVPEDGSGAAEGQRTLLVEGWRAISHSYAMVNQFQLLELAGMPDIDLYHRDAPFKFAHWKNTEIDPGFNAGHRRLLERIEACPPALRPDYVYRISSPFDLRPAAAGRLGVYVVTEFGLSPECFHADGGDDIRRFEAEGGIVITPSNWSRERIVNYGFSADAVVVVPHAANGEYFFPLPADLRQAQRRILGFGDDEVVLLNIGAVIWNKGIDILLQAFAIAREKRRDLRLVFKDQRHTYGVQGDAFIQATLAACGRLTDEVMRAITLIPANLNLEQMNAIYNVADCYVSPYRAEGYNLPVREAMACGTPVLATAGGATDDFHNPELGRKIDSVFRSNAVVQGRRLEAFHEPSLEALVDLLLGVPPKPEKRQWVPQNGSDLPMSWKEACRRLLEIYRRR